MKKEIADEWVKALPTYTQGKNFLRKGDKFCCLGVLCDLAVKHGIIAEGQDRYHAGALSYGEEELAGTLPDEVRNWAGMKDPGGRLEPRADGATRPFRQSLAELNDAGHTFEDIAEIISKNWELL